MVPVLSASQIRKIDEFTIATEAISSVNLMMRAAMTCCNYIQTNFKTYNCFQIFCGTGNNGGDGLCIAHYFLKRNFKVAVLIVKNKNTRSDFNHYYSVLKSEFPGSLYEITNESDLPAVNENALVIDALFGIGLSRKAEGIFSNVIRFINKHSNYTISIDIPSGLLSDESSISFMDDVVTANTTLTFQYYKTALLMSENADKCGNVIVLDIGLKKEDSINEKVKNFAINHFAANEMYHPRLKNSSKHNYGHACIIGGSKGKMGAMVIAATAALRTGVGLLSVQIPKCGFEIMQTSIPEAMIVDEQGEEIITSTIKKINYSAIGFGPGIGREDETALVLKGLIQNYSGPLVIDADGLNLLSENKTWLGFFQSITVLTPHTIEFQRLFGKTNNDFEKLTLAREMAFKYNCFIVLKGVYSITVSPNGNAYFNTSGNSGLAKGGSGDALTGMITALMAQNYSAEDAIPLAVYLHGKAADIALFSQSRESLIITDVISNIGKAFESFAQ